MLDYTHAEKIRRLNDCFRRSMAFGGSVLLTPGVACLDSQRKVELLEAVRRFDKFTDDNDPHREHDFSAIDLGVVNSGYRSDIGNGGGRNSGSISTRRPAAM